MDNIKTNTYGLATNAERKHSYALARSDSDGREAYWVGGFRKNGFNRQGGEQFKAKESVKIENAVIFPSKTAAYREATSNDKLQYHRVVPVLAKKNIDGFRTRWWVGRDPGR